MPENGYTWKNHIGFDFETRPTIKNNKVMWSKNEDYRDTIAILKTQLYQHLI